MGYATRTCAVCEKQYTPSYPAQRGCSRVCGQKLHPAYGNGTRTCTVCGATYRHTYSAQRTCGRACGAKINAGYAARVRTRWPHTKIDTPDCPTCGRVFIAARGRTYCSVECGRVRRLEQRRATRNWGNPPRATPTSKPCERCQSVTVSYPRRKCDPCVEAAERDRKQRGKRKRRAVKAGARSEPYTLKEIADRDRERCGLCGRQVDMGKAVPHPLAPTVDHVIPLSRNGDDTRVNVQLAHFRCNYLKGDRGSQQLALLG